jgi:hypothetical protein
MTNQAQGRKKSAFPAATTVTSGSYFDFVYSGTNYRILDTDFYSGLGVTGTLEQMGSTTSIPVLDTKGTVNRFRNLESGSGVSVSLSPQNGAKFSHNFANGSGGVAVEKDITATQPIVRNMQAGSGMSVAIDDDTDSIILTATGEVVASNTVVVSSISDLPTAVAGVITLSPSGDTDYLFLQNISTTNRFALTAGNATSIRAASPSIVALTYTGTGTMFTGTDPNLKFNSIKLNCANGSLFDMSSTITAGIVQMIECNVGTSNSLGTLNGNFISRFHNVAFEDIKTAGLTLTGAHSNFVMETVVVFLNGGTFIDFGTATFNSVNVEGAVVQTSAGGTTFLSGASSDANINANGLGVVSNNRISGSATPLAGIASEDARWVFALNDDIEDTRTDALLSMQANATETVIAVAGTPVLVAGTWTVEEVSQMAGTTAGRITLDTERNSKLPITTSLSVEPASGGSVSISVQVAVNGSVIANSKRNSTAASGSPTSITVPWQLTLTPADYVEIWVTNEDTTTNLLVSSAVLRVN